MLRTFAGDGAWCWFQDPRAVCIRHRFDRIYATWVTRTGALQIGAYDHDLHETSIFELRREWGRDDHGSGSLLVLPDGRLMVFYAQHNGRGLYCRTTSRPEDIGAWDDEIAVTRESGVTYSHPVHLRDEGLIHVFWRGADWKPAYATSPDGRVWSEARTLIRDVGRAANRIRPYLKVVSDGQSAIHFAFTDGHPRDEAQNSVFHFRYERKEFRTEDGSRLGGFADLPISHRSSSVVYDGKLHGVRAWIWDVALDRGGRPIIAYTRLPRADDHRYHYARWNGQTWNDVQITPGGRWFPQTPILQREREPHYSGGIALDHANPSIAYISLQIDGTFEIEKWTTSDDGNTWEATPITSSSRQDNVRPVVPHGSEGSGNELLWMQGHYVHYTNFDTRIQLWADAKA